MMSIALFNDTGNFPHAGCLAVSQAHNKLLKDRGVTVKYRHFVTELRDLWQGNRDDTRKAIFNSPIINELQEVDAVIVNGEGTIHHGAGLHLLGILAVAQEINKPTFLVNSVLQDCPVYHDVMKNLTDFTVRDAFSNEYLRSIAIPSRIVLDSIIEADFNESSSLDFNNRIVVTDFHHTRANDVGYAINKLITDLNDEIVYYPLEGKERFQDWQYYVANLRTSKLVVTGRHHGVYMAGLAGVPFVALPSNTWKIEGTFALFDNKIEVLADFYNLESACKKALTNQSLFKEFSHFLLGQKPLTTFDNIKPEPSTSMVGKIIKFFRGQ